MNEKKFIFSIGVEARKRNPSVQLNWYLASYTWNDKVHEHDNI